MGEIKLAGIQEAPARLRRRLFIAFFIKAGINSLAALLLLTGCVWLIMLKFRLDGGLWLALAFPAAALVVFTVCLISARSRLPDEEKLLAFIDANGRHGGMLMSAAAAAGFEEPPDIETPALRWNRRRPLACLLAGALFCGMSFMVPAAWFHRFRPAVMDMGPSIDDVAADIDFVEEEKIIEAEDLTALRERLGDMKRLVPAADAAKSWEAIDHARSTLRRQAAAAAEKGVAAAEASVQLESLAQMLASPGAADLDAETLAQALKAMAGMGEQALGANAAGQALSASDMRRAMANGRLSEEQLERLVKACRSCRGGVGEMLEKLSSRGMCGKNSGRRFGRCSGKRDAAALASFLQKCMSGSSVGKLMICCRPGRGGISRGRGDAPMSWRQWSDEAGVGFKELMLPEDNSDPSASTLLGLSSAEPDAAGAEESVSGAAVNAAAGAGQARKRRLLPRHRSVVGRYFERGR